MQRTILALTLACVTASAVQAAQKPITVKIPTDPKATYTILEVTGKWPLRTIITKREGTSGVSYSKRLFNCADHTGKYLGSGETLEQMQRSSPDPAMVPVVEYSIADFLEHGACAGG